MKQLLVIFLLMLSVCMGASAAVYMTKDKDGNTKFSDQPSSPQEKPVDLPPANISSPAGPNVTIPQQADQDTDVQTPNVQQYEYNYFAIVSPTDKQTFQNQRLIEVKIMLKPDLKSTDIVQLLLDGDPYGGFFNHQPNQKDQPFIVTLNNVPRGTHTLQAVIRDVKKNIIKKTNETTIYIHYHHTLNVVPVITIVPRQTV